MRLSQYGQKPSKYDPDYPRARFTYENGWLEISEEYLAIGPKTKVRRLLKLLEQVGVERRMSDDISV